MRRVYVDSSVILAILLDEPGAGAMARKLGGYDVFSSILLESEVRTAAHREDLAVDDELFRGIGWVTPQRALSTELKRVITIGGLRGGGAFHLACALHVFGDAGGVFLTLDAQQRGIAEQIGFDVVF